MLFKHICFSLVVATISSAAAVTKCNADLCLRALRATQIATRLPAASSDCSSFLAGLTTVTYTNTQSFSTTATSTVHITQTNTIHATTTETTIQTVISTVNIPGGTVIVTGAAPTLVKRTASQSSTFSFPQYATPCSGAVRFSSACSCIGVTSASPRSTTVTVSTTLSYTTVTSVTETTSITTTDVTKTETSVVVQTTTIPVVTTQTVVPFIIRATYTSSGNQVYLKLVTFRGFPAIGFTSDITQASFFYLQDSQLMVAPGTPATVNNESYSYIFLQPNPSATYLIISCSVSATSDLTCNRGAANIIGEVGGDAVVGLATTFFASGNNFPVLSLKAVF